MLPRFVRELLIIIVNSNIKLGKQWMAIAIGSGINSTGEEGILSHKVKTNKQNSLVAFQYVTLQGIKWLIVIPTTPFFSAPCQLDQNIIRLILHRQMRR